MNKWLIIFCSVLCLVGLSIPVFAVDSASSESETVSDPEVPTVNISDESVKAIADAVTQSGSITLNTGVTIQLPSPLLEIWNDYKYHFVRVNGPYEVYLTNSAPDVYSDQYFDVVRPYHLYEFREGKTGSGVTYTDREASLPVSGLKWADTHLYGPTGNLVYTSDVASTPDPTYTISFETGFDDLTFPSVSSDEFALPSVSYSGYVFEGWYLDSEYVYPYTSDYEFASSTTLYAKWHKVPVVSFVTGYEDLTFESQFADSLVLPRPSRSDVIFVGWYLDAEYTQPFSLGMELTEDVTLYAKWAESLPMAFFTGSLLGSFSTLFVCEPILYLMSLMALAVILGILKTFVFTRT